MQKHLRCKKGVAKYTAALITYSIILYKQQIKHLEAVKSQGKYPKLNS